MVEQARQASPSISLQAGPAEVDNASIYDVNLRINDRNAQIIGRQLAEIGDGLDRDWANRLPNPWPTALFMPRPAQVLTRTLYREIQSQVWHFQGLSTAAKAWITATAPGQGIFRSEALSAWVSSIHTLNCTGWTPGTLITVALVAMATICTAFWMEWRRG